MGFKCRRPIKKPKLTPSMVQKRLAWANLHKDMSLEDWQTVCFSDEATFQIMDDRAQFVRRRPTEKYDMDCVVRTVKRPASVMIWSVISAKGMGRLYVVEGTMRQDQYRKVLETKLLPQLQEWFGNGRKVFMQDGAPCHTAKKIKIFLQEQKIPLLPWPGNSPDMNPIENVWEYLKRELAKENITTKTKLIERIIYHWHHNVALKEIAQTCIDSMPRRVAALRQAKGGLTKY
ncbi:Transposable element Tcb2 transposase [Anthophora quadrimaculata]